MITTLYSICDRCGNDFIKSEPSDKLCSSCAFILQVRSRDFKEHEFNAKKLLSLETKLDICPVCNLPLPDDHRIHQKYHKECAYKAQLENAKKTRREINLLDRVLRIKKS